MSLADKKIVVALTGGIACYKVPYLIRFLTKAGASVRVIMTEAATRFITPLTLETVSGNPVAIDMFPENRYAGTHHIDMAIWPDLFIVAPATANFLGKVASGVSDDLLTTVICATRKPVMVSPAMNPGMWGNPVTQKNYKYLRELGYLLIDPAEGEMACEESGVGRMPEPEQLFEEIKKFFGVKSAAKITRKKKVLITAGPTREPIDPVRYISNQSSGKMGYALAEAAVAMGMETTLISGPVALKPPSGATFIPITTTEELQKAVMKHFKDVDCLIMSAAPADFTPDMPSSKKIKRGEGMLSVKLTPTMDILKAVAKKKRKKQVVVGFALETDNAIANARQKLKEKQLDMIILNQPGEATGFESDTNQVTILRPNQRPKKLPLQTKEEISFNLLALIKDLM